MQIGPPSSSAAILFQAHRTTSQTLANGADTKIICDSVDADIGGFYTAGTGRYLPTVAGWYMVSGQVTISTAADGTTLRVLLYKKGTDVTTFWGTIGKASISSQSFSIPVYLDGTDYIEMNAAQDSGSEETATGSATKLLTFFSAYLLRTA